MELRVEVRPASPFRLPRKLGKDGVTRRRGGVIERLLHDRMGEPVACASRRSPGRRYVWRARKEQGERAHRHRADAVRAGRGRRSARVLPRGSRRSADRGLAAQAAMGARGSPPGAVRGAGMGGVRATDRVRARGAIQSSLVTRLGRRWTGDEPRRGRAGLRDLPTAATLGGTAPAKLQSCDLAAARAIALEGPRARWQAGK